MRKALVLLLSAVFVSLLAGCSEVSRGDYDNLSMEMDSLRSDFEKLKDQVEGLQSDNTGWREHIGEDYESKDTGPEQTGQFDTDAVLSQLQVTEYQWEKDFKNVAIIIKNNSEYDLCPYIDIVLYDVDGDMVETSENYSCSLGAGSEMAYVFSYENFASYDYQISAKPEEYTESLTSNISYVADFTSDKSIIAVTNNGTKTAKFVEYIVLFFKGDTVVHYCWNSCLDEDSELKPGKTEYSQDYCHEPFDSIKVYVNAYTYEE